MKSRKIWDDSKPAEREEHADEAVSAAVKRAEGIEPPNKEDFFNWMYAELPDQLVVQRDTMRTSSIGQDPSQIESPQASQQS
jgi:pyruvate dehydrogenase E1 component alpha subunit